MFISSKVAFQHLNLAYRDVFMGLIYGQYFHYYYYYCSFFFILFCVGPQIIRNFGYVMLKLVAGFDTRWRCNVRNSKYQYSSLTENNTIKIICSLDVLPKIPAEDRLQSHLLVEWENRHSFQHSCKRSSAAPPLGGVNLIHFWTS